MWVMTWKPYNFGVSTKLLSVVMDKGMDLNNPESAELSEHLFASCNQLDEKISEVVEKSTPCSLSDNKV